MNVDLYELPTFNIEHISVVEHAYCDLINKYRSGETLDPEVLDWMDGANNWLMSISTK